MDGALAELLTAQFAAVPYQRGYSLSAERIFEAALFLRDERGYRFLRDIAAVDWLGRRTSISPSPKRFDVCYQLANLTTKATVTLKCFLDDAEPIKSLVGVFASAEFMEREVYDLMGIPFAGHPDLRRILLSDDWEGHPLRKDYPVTGYEMWDWRAHR